MQTVELKTKTVTVLHCLRCGGEWEQKFPDRLPKTCRWCNSPAWNKPRVRNQYKKGTGIKKILIDTISV